MTLTSKEHSQMPGWRHPLTVACVLGGGLLLTAAVVRSGGRWLPSLSVSTLMVCQRPAGSAVVPLECGPQS